MSSTYIVVLLFVSFFLQKKVKDSKKRVNNLKKCVTTPVFIKQTNAGCLNEKYTIRFK